jgi:5-methylcytosine-specific restriction endonuclease McrA
MNKNIAQVLKAGEKTRFKTGHAFVGKRENLNFKKGMIPWNKKPDVFISCLRCSKEVKVKPVHFGKQKFCSKKCADIFKDKGKTSEVRKLRSSTEYKLWRTAVFERDGYKCIWCKQIGGKLNADHIKRFADYPALRFAIDNGRTLCEKCHRLTDTFGNRCIASA